MLRTLVTGAAISAASGALPALAGPGADAFAAGDYRRALSLLEPQARRGQAEAQYLLGRMRENGLGVPADFGRARHWYGLAAAQGHAQARAARAALDAVAATSPPARTATMAVATSAPATDAQRLQTMVNDGAPADRERALRLAESIAPLALAGDTVLAVLLGEYFESPPGGRPDYPAAANWYARAAEKEHPVALNNLGAMYYDGRGVLQSDAEARRLYRRAAEAGDRVAQFNLALMLGQGRGGAADLPGMLDWLSRSAAQGYARAQAQLGRLHYEGAGTPRDLREAARLFRQAALQGMPLAQYWYGRMCARGEGVQRDLEAGADWIVKAAEGGVAAAMLEAARIFEMGLGLVSNNARAIAFYRRAAESGVADAADRLASAYAHGELGLAADAREAERWSAASKR